MDLLNLVSAGLEPNIAAGLLVASFFASFITVALGIGGGALLIAIMATLMPPAALIPIHGIVMFGSNIFRMGLLSTHVHWPPILGFAIGTLIGVTLGGLVVVDLPPSLIQIGVGGFVIWSVLLRPPKWLSATPWLTGIISSFLTMFFGATGVFVANFSKSLALDRRAHVATHACMMTLQHGLKVVGFAVLGFAFADWVWFILAMIAVGFLGTVVGRAVLFRITDRNFKKALDVILILISLRLIWSGTGQLLKE